MARNDGGPAFPDCTEETFYRRIPAGGMSLRDWFAGQALASLGAEIVRMAADDGVSAETTAANLAQVAHGVAGTAYLLADAMIMVRAKGGA